MATKTIDVDVASFDPDILKTTHRPGRSEALKHTHEAAAYDAWFRKQVRASLDDPRPSVSDDEARARFTTRKTILRQQPG